MMRKSDIPKPKFDIDDLIAYRIEFMAERADGVPEQKSEAGAGRVSSIMIEKGSDSTWNVSYVIDDDSVNEIYCKRINI